MSELHEKSSSLTSSSESEQYVNFSETGEIPSYNGSEKAKATDFANYFCSYAELHHQKQMLADHNRMAAYHAAIVGNPTIFKDKVVLDVGTGSGILAAWAAQAGAKRVYAVEYTDMAHHARSVMTTNGLDHIVTVIQGSIESIELPIQEHGLEPEEDNLEENDNFNNNSDRKNQVVDIIISEWMGYFLLRESMLDSLIRARDKFLKPKTGLMFPSHTTLYLAPIFDEEERKLSHQDYNNAMGDWEEFVSSTQSLYGVDMRILEKDFEREQRDYYLLSSRWAELNPNSLLAEPAVVKELDMCTCTLRDARGIFSGDQHSTFEFDIVTDEHLLVQQNGTTSASLTNPAVISGFAGWFTADFKSRTDEGGCLAPQVPNPSFLSTGPEAGYTHWGQQVFHLLSNIPLIKGEVTKLFGSIELVRTQSNARLYNCRIKYESIRKKKEDHSHHKGAVGPLMKSPVVDLVFKIP